MVFASRRQHLLEVIRAGAGGRQHVVLCDRFTDSTRRLPGPRSWRSTLAGSQALDELATGGLDPDLTILFDLPAEVARSRGHGGERLSRR